MLKLLFVPCVWNLLQIKYIFLRNSYFLKIKSFSSSCLLYYYVKCSMLLCFLLLYWVFIKSVFAVDSEVVAVCDILILKTLHFVVITCRVCYVLFWACFWLSDFGLFFLIVWCNFVLVIYWTVVLYEKEEKLWSDGALQRCFC